MINNFTSKFLNYSRITLFILFLLSSFNWYNSSDPTPALVTLFANIVGGISFLAWVYAIGHEANSRLKKKNIELQVFQFFNFGFVVILGSVLTMFLSQGGVNQVNNSSFLKFSISFTSPGEAAFVFLIGMIFILLVSAKALVSAEKDKEAEFGEYFTTLLLFIFSLIGLWFIQPRIKKLLLKPILQKERQQLTKPKLKKDNKLKKGLRRNLNPPNQ